MQDKIQKQILDAFFVVLRPIAKILLRYGIGFREFAEVAKAAFVDVASSEYGIRGRPTNMSRVAVMTGLTRKEVRRLRNLLEGEEQVAVSKTTPLWEVLHHWHSDQEFLDSSGRPALLPFQGEAESFSNLVRLYGGDIPAGAIRAELKRVSAIEETADGRLKVLKRSFRPEGDHETLVNSLVHAGYSIFSTIAHNTDPTRKSDTWPQRLVYSRRVSKENLGRLRRINIDRISDFSQAIDDMLMSYESKGNVDSPNPGPKDTTIAVGVFYFEELNEKMRHKW